MKKRNLLIIPALILSISLAFSQGKPTLLNEDSNPGEMIDELPLPPPPISGSIYLNEEWQMTEIIFKNALKVKALARYDLKNETLDINVNNEIKACPISLLNSFKTSENAYYNASEISNGFANSIAKVVYDGDGTILTFLELELEKSNYNMALDMGKRENTYKIIEISYYLYDNNIYIINNSFRKNKEIFKDYYSEVRQYSKDNNFKMKEGKGLIEIIKYYERIN